MCMYIYRLCFISHDLPFMGQRGSPEVSWPVLSLHPLPRGLAGRYNVQCHGPQKLLQRVISPIIDMYMYIYILFQESYC